MKLPIEDLEKTEREEEKPTKIVTRQNRRTIKAGLDLGGYHYEETIRALDQYIGRAVLDNYKQVCIVHDEGTGTFQKTVQNHLEKRKGVQPFHGGMPSEGGFDVIATELK